MAWSDAARAAAAEARKRRRSSLYSNPGKNPSGGRVKQLTRAGMAARIRLVRSGMKSRPYAALSPAGKVQVTRAQSLYSVAKRTAFFTRGK